MKTRLFQEKKPSNFLKTVLSTINMMPLSRIKINYQATGFFVIPVLVSFLLLFNTSTVYSQKNSADSVTFYSVSALDSLLNAKVSPERLSRLLGRSQDGSPYLLVTRNKAGDVEIHEQYDDVAIIRSGRGILKTGYEISGHKESGREPSREWLGGVIGNAKERIISPGDFIVIPAMLPHQYIPHNGETLTYWTIKVKAAKSVSR